MRTVIVTGASKGIGAAIVRSLRVNGVRVVGVARSGDQLKALAQEKIGAAPLEFVVGDVCDDKVARDAITLATVGGQSLVGLVLNAGTLGPVDHTSHLPTDEYRKSLDVNVVANVLWCQLSLPALRASQGRIIYTSSGVATMPFAGFNAYCAGKAAGNAMISVLAAEEPDIVAVAIAPGMVETEMFAAFHSKGAPFMSAAQRAFSEQLRREGKVLKPEMVADAYVKAVLGAPKSVSGKFIQWSDSSLAAIKLQ